MIQLYFKRIAVLLIAILSFQSLWSQSNQYLHFDRNNDYVQLDNAAALLDGTTAITMAGWFNTDALAYGQGMMSIRGGGTGSGQMYVIQLSNGKLECRVNTTTGLKQVATADNVIVPGVWQHLAWVFDTDSVRLYIDGTQIGSSAASGVFNSTDKPFTIGRCIESGLNFYFGGRADEVSLWKKALNPAEIADMMANELTGSETDLVAYYKFNQGYPGGSNLTITQLLSGISSTTDADLLNFALVGSTSNFDGTLEPGVQAISFPLVTTKLISDAPFTLDAIATSTLPITYEIVSGPATIVGDVVTLDGTPGVVTVKASQSGDATYDPAPDVTLSFEVIDPATVLVQSDVLHPLSGNVYAPSLMPIQIAINASIDFPEALSVSNVVAKVDGETVTLEDNGNGFYTGWWTPSAYGSHELKVTGTNSEGVDGIETVSFNLSSSATNVTVNAINDAWVYVDNGVDIQEANLPSYIGAYDKIVGKLIIDCPTGGCDPWDRVSHVEVQGKDGEWYEIIRYLTPYGVNCQSEIDLTDFASLLLGKTKFRVSLGTSGNGFLYTLNLEYQAGTAAHPYSDIQKLWYKTYQFGDMDNLQPYESFVRIIPTNTEAAKIKIVATGHGWGNNNTNNAAEFSHNKHHLKVNTESFEHDNWYACNPNPDGCSPQSGTWYHNRAGWCPGSIAQFFDYDLNAYKDYHSVELKYILDEAYKDYCHPNNPDCVSGTTCPNCNDGFNPHLITISYFIAFADAPVTLGVDNPTLTKNKMSIYPNPSTGKFILEFEGNINDGHIEILDITGKRIKYIDLQKFSNKVNIDVTGIPSGVYIVNSYQKDKLSASDRIVIE